MTCKKAEFTSLSRPREYSWFSIQVNLLIHTSRTNVRAVQQLGVIDWIRMSQMNGVTCLKGSKSRTYWTWSSNTKSSTVEQFKQHSPTNKHVKDVFRGISEMFSPLDHRMQTHLSDTCSRRSSKFWLCCYGLRLPKHFPWCTELFFSPLPLLLFTTSVHDTNLKPTQTIIVIIIMHHKESFLCYNKIIVTEAALIVITGATHLVSLKCTSAHSWGMLGVCELTINLHSSSTNLSYKGAWGVLQSVPVDTRWRQDTTISQMTFWSG